MTHVLTDSLLEDHFRCHSKSYLRFQGRLGQVTAYSSLHAQLDARHRANALQWLAAQSSTDGVSCFGGSRLADLTTGHAMILDAVGGAAGLETHFHGLQRMPNDPRLGLYYYQPIRVCRHLQPSSAIRLLLAFDALVLGYLQGLSPEHGVLICGPTFRRIPVHLRAYLESLATVLTDLRLQVDGANEPPLALNRHCDLCEFKQLCRVKAEDADNLTLLKGMTSKDDAP
jgi:predicted RecB family nuclease